ncbi:MAG: hypothetical protein Q8938_16990, partial [Bacteroidota bacterium]|nr:hypothetical protein [Bacteroidota bacterium]
MPIARIGPKSRGSAIFGHRCVWECPEAGSGTGRSGEQNPQFAPFFATFDPKLRGMHYRTFGRTGWKVSEVGYGMWG